MADAYAVKASAGLTHTSSSLMILLRDQLVIH